LGGALVKFVVVVLHGAAGTWLSAMIISGWFGQDVKIVVVAAGGTND
jgi:hypothetical protein